MGNIRIAARARDEAGNVVSGTGFEIRAYQTGTTTLVTRYLDSAGVNSLAFPGRPSTSTSTALTAQASSGQAVLVVTSTTGFSVGDVVHIAGGGNREEGIILTVTDATHLTLAGNLANTYATGTVGGPEDKGAFVCYVPTTTNTDVEIKVVATGKTYPRVTFPTQLGVKSLISRYVFNGMLTAINSGAASYVDFGGSFTTSVTTIAGDQVCVRVQTNGKKDTSGYLTVVADRGGTKLPAAGVSSSIYMDWSGSYVPFAFECWDTPGAGTFTYKPQLYASDAAGSHAGNGGFCQFVVEVWR